MSSQRRCTGNASPSDAQDAGHTPLKAGTDRVDITPPLGVAMAGYRRTRHASGIHDPLWAKALVLDDGRTQLALVGLDLICISRAQVNQARDQIQQRCGIPPEHVMCWATHTHTGPVTDENIPAGHPDPDYLALLQRKIADSVQMAQASLVEARWGVGVGSQDGLSFNRRASRRGRRLSFGSNELLALLREGVVPPAPETELNEWEEKARVVDPEVGVIYLESLEGVPIAALVSFALHCDTVGGDQLSAGYPYALSQALRQAKRQDMVVLFANGPCGDINHVSRGRDQRRERFQEARRIGKALAAEALNALAHLELASSISLSAARQELAIPPRAVSQEEQDTAREVLQRVPADQDRRERYYAEDVLHLAGEKESVRTEVQAMALGPLALVALPGEIFVELGLEIKQKSAFETTFVVELANDYVGYVPTRQAFDEGGYEVMTARTSRLAPQAGERIVHAALTLLGRLSGQPASRGRKRRESR